MTIMTTNTQISSPLREADQSSMDQNIFSIYREIKAKNQTLMATTFS